MSRGMVATSKAGCLSEMARRVGVGEMLERLTTLDTDSPTSPSKAWSSWENYLRIVLFLLVLLVVLNCVAILALSLHQPVAPDLGRQDPAVSLQDRMHGCIADVLGAI